MSSQHGELNLGTVSQNSHEHGFQPHKGTLEDKREHTEAYISGNVGSGPGPESLGAHVPAPTSQTRCRFLSAVTSQQPARGRFLFILTQWVSQKQYKPGWVPTSACQFWPYPRRGFGTITAAASCSLIPSFQQEFLQLSFFLIGSWPHVNLQLSFLHGGTCHTPSLHTNAVVCVPRPPP